VCRLSSGKLKRDTWAAQIMERLQNGRIVSIK
jgi:hypothetical protein